MRYYAIILCWLFVGATVYAGDDKITGEQLRNILSPAEQEHNKHKNDLKANELHLLLEQRATQQKRSKSAGEKKPEARVVEQDGKTAIDGWPGETVEQNRASNPEPKKDVPASKLPTTNSKTAKQPTAVVRPKPAAVQPQKAQSQDPKKYRRVPPSWGANVSNAQATKLYRDDPDKKTGPLFGIRRGTEIRARLVRATTNVSPGYAEFETTANCFGDYKEMPAGTKIYLNKVVASGSNRLYFTPAGQNAITPEGQEFAIVCSVTDITANKQVGIVGAITTDEKIIQRSMASGAFAAGQSVVSSISGGNMAANALGAAAGSALQEKEGETAASLRRPSFVILVNPQDVYIRVDKSF